MASGRRKRVTIGVIVAVIALLALATTAFAAGFGGRAHFAAPTNTNHPKDAPGGMRGFGPRAIVTAVDTTNQTISLGGVPQQLATIKVNQSVKLVAIQPDGTTKDATIGDFKTGSLVEVHIRFNGRGRRPGWPGNRPNQPGNGPNQPNLTVTELALVPAGQVRVEGLVTATGGTLTIVDGGGLQLTINPSGSVKVTKGTATAALSDIKIGDRIIATGTQNGATVNADTLRIFDLSAMKPGMRGGPRPGMGRPGAPPST